MSEQEKRSDEFRNVVDVARDIRYLLLEIEDRHLAVVKEDSDTFCHLMTEREDLKREMQQLRRQLENADAEVKALRQQLEKANHLVDEACREVATARSQVDAMTASIALLEVGESVESVRAKFNAGTSSGAPKYFLFKREHVHVLLKECK